MEQQTGSARSRNLQSSGLKLPSAPLAYPQVRAAAVQALHLGQYCRPCMTALQTYQGHEVDDVHRCPWLPASSMIDCDDFSRHHLYH